MAGDAKLPTETAWNGKSEERRGADEQFLLSNPSAWQINNQQ